MSSTIVLEPFFVLLFAVDGLALHGHGFLFVSPTSTQSEFLGEFHTTEYKIFCIFLSAHKMGVDFWKLKSICFQQNRDKTLSYVTR